MMNSFLIGKEKGVRGLYTLGSDSSKLYFTSDT